MKSPEGVEFGSGGMVELDCDDVRELIHTLKEKELEPFTNISEEQALFFIVFVLDEEFSVHFWCSFEREEVDLLIIRSADIIDDEVDYYDIEDDIVLVHHRDKLFRTDHRQCPIVELFIEHFISIDSMQEVLQEYYRAHYKDFCKTLKKPERKPTCLGLVPPSK